MCSVGRKIYQCIKRTRRYNTWVEEHDGTTSEYWVKIYESPLLILIEIKLYLSLIELL